MSGRRGRRWAVPAGAAGAAGAAGERERATVRVAMDGSFLALPPSGTGTYVRALSGALRDAAPDLDLVLLDPGWGNPCSPAGEQSLPSRGDRFAWEMVGVTRAARRVAPDLLHVPHFSAPLRPGCPLVVTVHDAIPLVWPAYRASRAMRLRLAVVRRTVRAARLVLTPSAHAAGEIARVLDITREQIRVTPEATGPEFVPAANPTPPDLIAVARRFGVAGRYVFNTGGYDVRKNLPVLVEAFARALPRLSHLPEPVQLVIGGAPHSTNQVVFPPLEPLVTRLGLVGKVILTGFLSPADHLALYQGAAVYVTPSLHEGFGLTALEAMACGVPVIAANRTSLPEVVGDAGLLVEPEPELLAAAMVELLTDPDRTADLRARGLARAATFTWEHTAQLTIAAYEEALARIGDRPRQRHGKHARPDW